MTPKILQLDDKYLTYKVIKNYQQEILKLISQLEIKEPEFKNYLNILEKYKFFYLFQSPSTTPSDQLLAYPNNKIKDGVYNASIHTIYDIKENFNDYLYLNKNFILFNNYIEQAIKEEKYPKNFSLSEQEIKDKNIKIDKIKEIVNPLVEQYNNFCSKDNNKSSLINIINTKTFTFDNFFSHPDNFHLYIGGLIFPSINKYDQFKKNFKLAKKLYLEVNQLIAIDKIKIKNIFADQTLANINTLSLQDKSSLNSCSYIISTKSGFVKYHNSYRHAFKKSITEATLFPSFEIAEEIVKESQLKNVSLDIVKVDIILNQSIYSQLDGGDKELLANAVKEKIDQDLIAAAEQQKKENIRLKEILQSHNIPFEVPVTSPVKKMAKL